MFHIADNQDCQQVNEVSQDCFFFTFSKKTVWETNKLCVLPNKAKNDVSSLYVTQKAYERPLNDYTVPQI